MDHQLGQPLDQHHWNDRDDAHFDCCDAFVRVLAHCLLNVNLFSLCCCSFIIQKFLCVFFVIISCDRRIFFPFYFFQLVLSISFLFIIL